jgi:hypothetical protein
MTGESVRRGQAAAAAKTGGGRAFFLLRFQGFG